MPNMAKQTKQLINRVELPVRLSLHRIWKKHREDLPLNAIRTAGVIPFHVHQGWINDYTMWFRVGLRPVLLGIWGHSIRSIHNAMYYKLTPEAMFEDYITTRSMTLGSELAYVEMQAIRQTLIVGSQKSWTALKYDLKKNIGLLPGQINALEREAKKIRKKYPKVKDKDKVDRAIARARNRKLNYRAELIARTETGNAANHAQIEYTRQLQREGKLGDTQKRWSTVGDNVVSEGCENNEMAGWIDINDEFPSGHDRPLRFPGCRCACQFRPTRGRTYAGPGLSRPRTTLAGTVAHTVTLAGAIQAARALEI
jgi:hypothetical protein